MCSGYKWRLEGCICKSHQTPVSLSCLVIMKPLFKACQGYDAMMHNGIDVKPKSEEDGHNKLRATSWTQSI